jgi:methyltransferase (TIGR00027 family)
VERHVLRAASPRANRLLRWCEKRWFRALVRFAEANTIPGILRHYVLRKRWLEDFVRQSLATGCTQVVVLGGGFDTLALRLSREYPKVSFMEFDHSATQRVKSRALRNAEAHPNLYLHPLDFRGSSMATALQECSAYHSDQRTLFVAEGLLMYLGGSVVEALFRDLARSCTAHASFAWTFLEPQSDGSINFLQRSRLVDWWLERRGEPFLWGIQRSQLATWLETHGWSLRIVAQPDMTSVNISNGSLLPTGEWIGIAEIN